MSIKDLLKIAEGVANNGKYRFARSEDECLRPSGLFLVDGDPVIRTLAEKPMMSEQNKLRCGTCGGVLNYLSLCVTCAGDDANDMLNPVHRSIVSSWRRRPITVLEKRSDKGRQNQHETIMTSSSSLAGDSSVLSGSASMSSATFNSSNYNSKYSSVISRDIPPRIEASPEWIGALLMGWKEKKKSKRWNVERESPDKEFMKFIHEGNDKWTCGSTSNADSSSKYVKNISRRLVLPSYKDMQTLTNMCTKKILVTPLRPSEELQKQSDLHRSSKNISNVAPNIVGGGNNVFSSEVNEGQHMILESKSTNLNSISNRSFSISHFTPTSNATNHKKAFRFRN